MHKRVKTIAQKRKAMRLYMRKYRAKKSRGK